jgi:hypothetical protein
VQDRCLEVSTFSPGNQLSESNHHRSSARSFHPICKAASLPVMMAEDRIDLLRQAVRSMLAALQMPDVDDNELHDLTLHIGYTGELESLLNLLP